MNTPSINPHLTATTSTQHNDSSIGALCKKIIKLVATIFLVIITLGLYLVWKYCCPSSFPCISKKQPTPIPSSNEPIFIFDSSGKLIQLPQHIVMDSLEFMNEIEKHGLHPYTSQRFSPFGTLNPSFVASYPLSISNVYAAALTRLQELVTSPSDEQRAVAEACLAQLNYLDQHYYIVSVPGDHSCFFRSYAIGWLCSLDKKKQTNAQAFEQEIQKLLNHPFAYSSQKNALLTQQAITILQKCQQCTSVNQLYNEIILSTEAIQPLIIYLRQLSFYAADQQKKEVLGEDNLRTLLLAQIREDKTLFERAVTHFLGRGFESHLSMESMLTQTQVFDSALEESLFLLEFLPLCLLSQHQLSTLPTERRDYKKMQIILASFLTFVDWEIRAQFSESSVKHLLNSPVMKQQLHEFVSYWSQRFPQLSFSYPTLLYLFLRTHPYYLNQTNITFVQQITHILTAVLGSDTSLCKFLKLSPAVAQAYNDMLSSCKAYAISIDLLEAFLQTPLTILNPLISSLPNHSGLSTIRRIYGKLMQCLINTPLTQANRNQLAQLTQLFYASASTVLVEKIEKFKNNLSILCPIDEHCTPEVSQALILFLFFIQHQNLLEQLPNNTCIFDISSFFMPHLQNSMRQQGALPVFLLAQACGDFCSIGWPHMDQSPKSLCKNILSLMFENLHAANLLQTLFHLPSLFGHRLPAAQEVADLSRELSLALPEVWENHVRGAEALSKLLHLNSEHPTLGASFLLISFLLQNQERFEVLPQPLKDRVRQTIDQIQLLVDEHVTSLSPIQQETLVLRYESLYRIHQRVRQHVIIGAPPANNTPAESFLNYLVLRSIEQMSLEELLLFSQSIFYQAEDDHITGLASALENLSVCQSFQDSQFTSSPAQILPLADSHGFLSLDFLPEDQGSVFLLKENNHYSALLPK